MLVLTRKKGETIYIGDDIKFVILSYDNSGVKLGITAPDDIPIYREEIYIKIQKEKERTKNERYAEE